MHDDLVAHPDVGDGRSCGVHPARVLVADRARQGHTGLLGPLALEDVQVRPAPPTLGIGRATIYRKMARYGIKLRS
ncbi:hypothetical protein [Lentzea sp. NPDC060358]|uniref:hypothetical protein n=1 Tax=Lentzea sp. NPDC060358 TaxID=3347103 RepID=UPI00364DB7B6